CYKAIYEFTPSLPCFFQIRYARLKMLGTRIYATENHLILQYNLRHRLPTSYANWFTFARNSCHYINPIDAQCVNDFKPQLRHTGCFQNHVYLPKLFVKVSNLELSRVNVSPA